MESPTLRQRCRRWSGRAAHRTRQWPFLSHLRLSLAMHAFPLQPGRPHLPRFANPGHKRFVLTVSGARLGRFEMISAAVPSIENILAWVGKTATSGHIGERVYCLAFYFDRSRQIFRRYTGIFMSEDNAIFDKAVLRSAAPNPLSKSRGQNRTS